MVSYDIAGSTTGALNRRQVLTGGAAMLGAACLAGCGHRSARPATLRVAVIGKGATDTRLLFPAAGIVPEFPISYAEFESGHLAVEALNSGAIDLIPRKVDVRPLWDTRINSVIEEA